MNPLAILDIGSKLIDKVWPDPEKKAEAQAKLLTLQQNGELKELEISMSAILAEAQSSDPWTSRARPSFLYVVYVIILSAIPMGVLHAISPDTATNIAVGFKAWLEAIPDPMWYLFGSGYLGYSGARSFDKAKMYNGKKM
jgi:hypothetical protein